MNYKHFTHAFFTLLIVKFYYFLIQIQKIKFFIVEIINF